MKELGCDIKSSLKDTVFPVTDVLSNFAGNIKDAPGVFKVAKHFKPINIGIFTHIINELKGKGIKAIEYLGKNGERYIKLTDRPGIRKYLNATRYLINNKKIMEVGIGSVAMEGSIVKGARFGVIYSAAYRSVELMFKSEYDLTNFFVNLSMDMAKIIVATIIAKSTVAAATSFVVTAALSTTAIAIGVFIIGALVVWGLMWLDDEFKISETIIKKLKEHKVKTPISTYHPDQIFNAWGRYYRG